MILASADYVGLAAILSGLASLVGSSAAMASILLNSRRLELLDRKVQGVKSDVGDVHREVKTANAQTAAQLLDATETRRIDEIPPELRTELEKSHVASNPVMTETGQAADQQNRPYKEGE